MPRSQGTTKFSKAGVSSQPASRKSFNAVGYAKRKSLKSHSLSTGSPGDVYEYQSGKVRRGKIKMQLERDELAVLGGRNDGDGSDDEDSENTTRRGAQPRLVGEDEDEGGVIGEDEDEEIDSDEAFEESDEERFAGFSFSNHKLAKKTGKKAKKAAFRDAKSVQFAEVDLNEDSDGVPANDTEESEDDSDVEEDGDSAEFIDVLDILDGRGEPESEDIQSKDREGSSSIRVSTGSNDDEEGGQDNGESSENDDDEAVASQRASSVSEAEDEDALHNLGEFITNLDAGQKRKAPDDEPDALHEHDKRVRKRRLLKEQTQIGTENEFAAQPGIHKLNFDDLLAPLESSSDNLQSLKKSVKALASSSAKAHTLAAPLPQRTQERLDREAAYEQTKEEIDKWSGTMKRIKEAEHLSFPLQSESSGKTSNLELAAKFKMIKVDKRFFLLCTPPSPPPTRQPTTALESAVDTLLKSAQMREQDLVQTESLKMNHLSVEEVSERRAELAKMRELMFRAEAKAKRVAKIKSKTYRRIRKKGKGKGKQGGDAGDEDVDDEDEGEDGDGEEVRLRKEVDRARERATLRHKNTGKWARAMKARGELDVDQRREINEMLDRGERLRKRIQGQASDAESESDDDDDDEVSEGGIRASAFDELHKLDAAEEHLNADKKGKGVFEMKFMKDAMAREQRRADEMVTDFVRELGGHEADDNAEDDDRGPEAPVQIQASSLHRVGGRLSFRPGSITSQLRAIPSLASDTSSMTLKSTDVLPDGTSPAPATPSPITSRSVPLPAEPKTNPWLDAHVDSSSHATRKKHEVSVGKNSALAEKSKNKLRKRVRKREEGKEREKDEAVVDVEMANVMTPRNEAGVSAAPMSQRETTINVDEGEESEVLSELDAQEDALEMTGKGKLRKDVQAFEQRELVARAFAGDNVVRDFADAKRREMEADAPKEVDTTLAGWGSWGGAGTRHTPAKPYLVKKVAGVDPTSRADYKKTHVVISEKRDKKASKYQVKDLPFPYTSKAQFERRMDTPLGTEWNTRVGFQRGTLPKVVKKMGTVITPLEKLF
ncbi:Utp14 protein-domain-containing protein [Cytidiella melzeri]|nr:Utp14 protein-domain-containing protein [Cytidiella melzeri]